MNPTTVAVDLAKSVFELAVADEHWKVVERARLTRGQFERWFQNRSVRLVVMEACATAHHWARTLRARGMEVRLLPAKYVRAYVKRNKTDAADALALLEAARGADITPVGVKSIEQQALQALHRLRSGWMTTRTRRINTLRGFCREFGMEVSVGAARGLAQIARLLADEHSAVPAMLRAPMRLALEEIRLMGPGIGDGRHHGGARVLRFGPPLRKLLRPHPTRVLIGRSPLPGAHLQARQPLHPNIAHPRGALGASRGHRVAAHRAQARPAASLGAGSPGALEPQQGDLRSCQQARSHRLGRVGEARALPGGCRLIL